MTTYEIPPDLRPWCEVVAPTLTTDDWASMSAFVASNGRVGVNLRLEVTLEQARALLAYADEVAAGLLLVDCFVLGGARTEVPRVTSIHDAEDRLVEIGALRCVSVCCSHEACALGITDWGSHLLKRVQTRSERMFSRDAEISRSERVLRTAILDVMCSQPVDEIGERLRRALIESREPEEHPEDRCEECREPFETWWATQEDWAAATGRDYGGPILCRPCFDVRAGCAKALRGEK